MLFLPMSYGVVAGFLEKLRVADVGANGAKNAAISSNNDGGLRILIATPWGERVEWSDTRSLAVLL